MSVNKNETTRTNFQRTDADLRYHINGGGRDTYIYADNGGFHALHRPRE